MVLAHTSTPRPSSKAARSSCKYISGSRSRRASRYYPTCYRSERAFNIDILTSRSSVVNARGRPPRRDGRSTRRSSRHSLSTRWQDLGVVPSIAAISELLCVADKQTMSCFWATGRRRPILQLQRENTATVGKSRADGERMMQKCARRERARRRGAPPSASVARSSAGGFR